jgi:mono/diheme cytochrome c family protein
MLFVRTDGRGLYRSSDGADLPAPGEGTHRADVAEVLVSRSIHDGRRVYAASHSIGLFRSGDGETWNRPERFRFGPERTGARAWPVVVASPRPRAEPIPPPPSEFLTHCNRCHGWTDPALDTRSDVIWRAAPTPRDWTETVRRMGRLAVLNGSQVESITRYLNTHFGSTAAGAP